MGSFRNDYAKWSQEGRAEALGKADEFHKHPHVKHYHDAASHFKKAMEASVHGDDDEIVRHFDRGVRSLDKGDKKTGAKPVMGVKENLPDDQELDEIARATLERYRAKAKAKFRANGGINAALEKQDRKDKESMNPNRKKAVNEKLTDDAKSKIRNALDNTSIKKGSKGARALIKIAKTNPKNIQYNPMKNEAADLIARIMTQDEIPYAPYRETMEERCDRIADAKKQELKMALFNFAKEED